MTSRFRSQRFLVDQGSSSSSSSRSSLSEPPEDPPEVKEMRSKATFLNWTSGGDRPPRRPFSSGRTGRRKGRALSKPLTPPGKTASSRLKFEAEDAGRIYMDLMGRHVLQPEASEVQSEASEMSEYSQESEEEEDAERAEPDGDMPPDGTAADLGTRTPGGPSDHQNGGQRSLAHVGTARSRFHRHKRFHASQVVLPRKPVPPSGAEASLCVTPTETVHGTGRSGVRLKFAKLTQKIPIQELAGECTLVCAIKPLAIQHY